MACGLQMKLGSMQKIVTDVAVDLRRGVAVPGAESAITMVSNTAAAPVIIPVSIPASSSLRQPGYLQLRKCEHHTPRSRQAGVFIPSPARQIARRSAAGLVARNGSAGWQPESFISASVISYQGSSALTTATS
jgi:hypothetical protein